MNWIGMFPGQGSQEIGMGKELLKTHGDLLIDTFNESLGWSIDEIINSKNSEEIKKTNIAQPYIFAISYCYGLEAIKKMGEPSALIGHSLGEYTALALSGYFTYSEALKVIAIRGEEMQKAVEDSNTGMAAVLTSDMGKTLEEINNLNSQDIEIWISNYNDASQIVVSGNNEDLEYIKLNPKSISSKRIVPLEVAGAFHSRVVSPAKKEVEKTLDEIDIKEGNIPVYMNFNGKITSKETLKDSLINQIDSSVMFYDQILNIENELKPDLWCHIGPGNVTAGMVRKSISYKDLKVINSLESSK
jgi:malonyl CoA-acyl carrier protein transacylase